MREQTELQHGRVEYIRPGVSFLQQDWLRQPAVAASLASAGSQAEPIYVVVVPPNQMLMWWHSAVNPVPSVCPAPTPHECPCSSSPPPPPP